MSHCDNVLGAQSDDCARLFLAGVARESNRPRGRKTTLPRSKSLLVLRHWLLAGCCSLFAASAAAQASSDADRAAARELGKQGLTALDQGNFAVAEDRLSRAIALHDVPTLRLARARARRASEKLVSAGEDYRAVLRWPTVAGEPSVFVDARRDARSELEALEPRIPRLTIVLQGGPATVTVGGFEWPQALIGVARPMDPGEYVVEVHNANRQVESRRVRLVIGQSETLTLAAPVVAAPGVVPSGTAAASQPAAQASGELDLGQPAPSPAPSGTKHRSRTAAYVTGAVALTLVVGVAVTGVLYLDARSDYHDHNNAMEDQATKSDLKSKASTMGWICNGLAAGALVTGGISAYLFLAPDSSSAEVGHAKIRSSGIARTEFGVVGRF
jgi:hypothetical protein